MSRCILFLWSGVSGYMAACWKALQRTQIERILVVVKKGGPATDFGDETMIGVEWEAREQGFWRGIHQVGRLLEKAEPDAVVLGGWSDRAYLLATLARRDRRCPLILSVDNVWKGSLRQQLGRLVVRPVVNAFDTIVVPGERGADYVRRLGFPWERIAMPLYGIDFGAFNAVAGRDLASRKRFIFVGRYVPEKGLSTLLQAYRRYRKLADDPWPLITCGTGPLRALVAEEPGVEDRGFVQPRDLPGELGGAGAFVLPSWEDHWPLAIVEACAAGLPIIATRSCGSTVECIRDRWNGFLVPPRDVGALCGALLAMHRASDRAEMGQRSVELARPYAAEQWAASWVELVERAILYRRFRRGRSEEVGLGNVADHRGVFP